MKTKKFIIKPVSLFLAMILMLFAFSSCGYKPEQKPEELPEENTFELVMDFAETVVKKGSTVTYRTILKNNGAKSYALQCPLKPIYISVVKAEEFSDEKPVFSTLSESGIAAYGQIEEFYDFTPTEPGDYILKAYSQFSIEGAESTKDYFYETAQLRITVY